MKETIEHNNRFYGEELKTESEQLKEWLIVANKENERLNNIINELEKYIIDFKEDYEKNEFQPNAKVYIYWKDLIDKLQELKGSDKE